MKTNIFIGLIFSAIALCLTFIFIKLLRNNKNDFSLFFNFSDNSKLQKEITYDNIKSININLKNENIFFEINNSNKIKISYYGNDKNIPEFSNTIDSININSLAGNKKSSFLSFAREKIVVSVPEGFLFENISIILKSGNIHANNISSNTIKIENKSGNLHIDNITGKNFIADCKSGSFHIKNINVAETTLNSISGSISIENLNCDNLICNTTSGSINIKGNSKKIYCNATSGSINGEFYSQIEKDSTFNTTSGSVKLKINKDSNYNINYSCKSGYYYNEHTQVKGKKGTDIMGNGSVNININSTSGSISIN